MTPLPDELLLQTLLQVGLEGLLVIVLIWQLRELNALVRDLIQRIDDN